MMRKFTTGALSVLLAFGTAALALEADRPQQAGKGSAKTDIAATTVTIDANQIDMFITNVGVFAYDKSNIRGKADGMYFPNNYPLSDKTVIYDAGMWLGGVRGGDTLVTVAEYSQEFVPGPLGGDQDAAENRVYKIYKNHEQKVADGYMVRDPDDHAATIPLTLEDYSGWPEGQGAPLGEDGTPWINELGADQMTFTVFNDGDPAAHSNDAGSTAPIGVEVRQTTFAFDRSDALGNVIFMKYELLYDPAAIGADAAPLENAYLSLWSDPDLGGSGDDYVGCDPAIGLGYCYNATNLDKAYGSAPPATGFDFFQGPPDGEGGYMGMSSFNKYINGTDPHSYADTYNYMQGLNIDGTPLDNGTTFQVPGDPVTGIGELDTDPADRRFMMSTGPFTLQPGETIEIYAAVMAAQGTNRLSSVTFLKYVDTFAQSAFEADFVVPQPPAAPGVTAEVLDRRVILTWDGASEEDAGDYPFQGYNVYQGETATGPWTRIATYDIQDGVATIFMETFDPETGEIYSQPVQFGGDSGLMRYIDITDDAFTWAGNTGLVNYHSYYFGVSAYSYNAEAVPNNLESSPTVLIVSPERSHRGTDYTASGVDVTHTAGIGTGSVTVNVANPEQITGHTYEVSFTDTMWITQEWEYNEDHTDSTLVDVENSALNYYSLTNTNNGEVLIDRGMNTSGDPNVSYPVTDGFEVMVTNHPDVIAAGVEWLPETDDTPAWLSGVDWGGPIFGGGASLGMDFFGSTLGLDEMVTIEVVLTPTEADWSDAAVYRRDLGYAFTEIGTFPGSAWDITVDPPRRLNLCFVEHDDPADEAYTADGHWNPNGSLGARQYLFVMQSDYNGSVDYDDANFGPESDVLWAVWPNLVAESGTFDENLAAAPGAFRFVAAQPFIGGVDTFSISTTAVDRTAISYALDDIRVVPNPYYGFSAYETKSDVKVVKFTHLPSTATIKIFNIAGDHLKTLYKDPEDGFELSWDLKNEYGVYVASGVYVYYVESPGLGDAFGKMAVMLEEERLKEY